MNKDKVSFGKYAFTGGWLAFWIFMIVWLTLGVGLRLVEPGEGGLLMFFWGLTVACVALVGNYISYKQYLKR